MWVKCGGDVRCLWGAKGACYRGGMLQCALQCAQPSVKGSQLSLCSTYRDGGRCDGKPTVTALTFVKTTRGKSVKWGRWGLDGEARQMKRHSSGASTLHRTKRTNQVTSANLRIASIEANTFAVMDWPEVAQCPKGCGHKSLLKHRQKHG